MNKFQKHSEAFRLINLNWDVVKNSVLQIDGYYDAEGIENVAKAIWDLRTPESIAKDDEQLTYLKDYKHIIHDLFVSKNMSNSEFLAALEN